MWLSRINWSPSDSILGDDMNNLGNDIRNWGGNVNGGGYTLYNCQIAGTGYLVDPTTTVGDLIVHGPGTPGALQRLAVGADGLTLVADHTQPLGVKWGTASGGLVDPTTTKGDLIVRGAAAPPTRLNVGLNGQVLMADSAQPLGIRWGTISGMSASGGDKQIQFNQAGAFGANAALNFDYTNARLGVGTATPAFKLDVAGDINTTGVFRVNGVPLSGGAVSSVFGRTGAVVAQAGDYTAAQVGAIATGGAVTTLSPGTLSGAVTLAAGTNVTVTQSGQTITIASSGGTGGMTDPTTTKGDLIVHASSGTTRLGVGTDNQILIADSTQTAGIKWGAAPSQTPWTSNIDGGGFYLTHAGSIGISASIATAPQYMLDIRGPSVATSQVHVSYDGTDTGGYVYTHSSGAMYRSAGIAQVAGSWIAKATAWSISNLLANAWSLYLGAGATVGAAVTLPIPTLYASGTSVGINTSSPQAALDISGAKYGWPGTSGSAANDSNLRIKAAGHGESLDIGSSTSVWIQARDFTNYASNLTLALNPNGGNVGIGLGTAVPAYQLQLSSDSAAKPSTNTWTVASDIRLKRNVEPYDDGLAAIRQVRAIRYTYNGKAGLPEIAGVGIDAEAHKDILPDCITTQRAEIDGVETDLHMFNSHTLTFMLINAVKELAARLERIEKGEIN